MAGTSRRQQAPNIRIVRLPCTGRIDPVFVLKAFEQGADGVIVSGCHPGDCHYVQGNMLARRRLSVFGEMMEFLGLDRRRLRFAWVSASEGVKWSHVVDEATAAVREVGPLDHHSSPNRNGSAVFALPVRGPGPRSAPVGDEVARVAAALRAEAAALIAGGEVSIVAGYERGSLPDQMVPRFATDPAGVEALDWNEHCASNLAVYLPELLKREGKVGLVVKSCDAKAVVGLVRENQVDRDRVVLIGVPCTGVWENGRLAAKCYACADEISPFADVFIDPASSGGRAVADDPRDAEIASLEALSASERWEYWQRQFGRCIRCYACRAVCPLCYCGTCVADKTRPQWIPVSIDGAGNRTWNVIRAMHLAGRCVGCDECRRACPAGIRLDLLNRRIANEVEDRFGYRPEQDPGLAPPLTTFLTSDQDEFV
jgi:coenzyme F420-reducing hydrogenase delta subunit/ferredoxin